MRNRPQQTRQVGLDVSDSHLAAAQVLLEHDGSIRLEAAGWSTPPPDADLPQMAEAVRQLFRQANLSRDAVCSAMISPGLVVKHFRHLNLKEAELARVLAIEAEETLQLPTSQLCLDWHRNVDHADGAPVDGVLVAMPKVELDRHLQMLALANIFPRIVDVGCLAVCNLYLHLKEMTPSDQATAVVCLARDRADIAILFGNHQIFPRTICSPRLTWGETNACLAECLSDTIKYHQFILHGPPVTRMVLTGAVPQPELLMDQLRKLVPQSEFWNPIFDLDSVNKNLLPRVETHSGALLATSLGLALRRDRS